MTIVAVEILLLTLLLVTNGVFAMTEIAIVSAKRGQLSRLSAEGNRGAQVALNLLEEPNRFLSTVQIGITLVGVLSGAFGGAHLASRLVPVLSQISWLKPLAEEIAFGLVILLLTYLSLVIGELVPKRVAMLRPEAIAVVMSRPMNLLSMVASPAVSFLSWSTDRLLRLSGIRVEKEQKVTKEEVSVLVREGVVTGSLDRTESRMIEGVLRLDVIDAAQIMTPKPLTFWLRSNQSHSEVWHKLVASRQEYFPLQEGDEPLGVVSKKSLYAQLAAGLPVQFRDLVIEPLLVPEQQSALVLFETFRSTGVHVALVLDEFGRTVGMVTLEDLLEAVVGELPSREERRQPLLVRRDDNSYLAEAVIDIGKLSEELQGFILPDGAGDAFQTLAGFFLHRIQCWPKEGDCIEHGAWRMEIIDMDEQRIDKILLTRVPEHDSSARRSAPREEAV